MAEVREVVVINEPSSTVFTIGQVEAVSLYEMRDVFVGAVMNNDILKYDSASGKWIASAGFKVLGPTEPVPAGLRAGTMIFRTS